MSKAQLNQVKAKIQQDKDKARLKVWVRRKMREWASQPNLADILLTR